MSDESSREVAEAPRRPLWRRAVAWLPVVAIIAGGIAVFFLLADVITLSEIIRRRAELVEFVDQRTVLTVAIYVLAYVGAVVFSVPGGSFLTVVGGILFGGLVGGLITTAAATAGAVIVFLVAATALRGWASERLTRVGPRAARAVSGLRDNAFVVIVVLRLVPVMPFWASNAIPALFSVPLGTYVLATLVGLLPWTVGFAYFGEALDRLVADQEAANPGCAAAGTCEIDLSAVSAGPIITGVAVSALALLPVVWHWIARRRERRASDTKV